VNDLEARALVLAGLACVDLVVASTTTRRAPLIEAARPDVLIKGGDYNLDFRRRPRHRHAYGGEVRLAPYIEGHSTTEISARSRDRLSGPIILVTGGAGFIGSNIVARLAPTPPRGPVCDSLGGGAYGKWRNLAKHPIADLISPQAMWPWLEKRRDEVDIVIHMGASARRWRVTSMRSWPPILACRATSSLWCAHHRSPDLRLVGGHLRRWIAGLSTMPAT